MSDLVKIPPSQTDPYAPEPTNTAPVRLRLTRADGRTVLRQDDARVLAPHLLLQADGVLFVARGVDDGVRLYREIPVLVLDTRRPLTPREARYLVEVRSLTASSAATTARRHALATAAMEDALVAATGARSFQELIRMKESPQ